MDRGSRLVLLAALLVICLPAAGAAMDADSGDQSADVTAAERAEETSYSADRLFVKGDVSLLDGVIGYDSAVPAWKGSQWSLVTLSEGEDAVSAEERLKDSGMFDDVERESILAVPDIMGSDDAPGPEDNHLADMRVTEVWDYLESIGKPRYGSPDVVIAVIDTGMDADHEALKDCLWTNPGEIPGNGMDDDGNGYVDDIHGWDFGLYSPSMDDIIGHGTHVTGIIAASPDSVCPGVASGCSIMPLRVMLQSGIPEGAVLKALEYAVDNGASVVNMSIGAMNAHRIYTEYIAEISDDVLIVNAAGNNGCCNNPDHSGLHPTGVAGINMVWGPLGVMNAEQGGTESSAYTNYDDTPFGTYEYGTYAVGTDICSTMPGGYGYQSGTSMAAPIISGVAGLLLTAHPDMTVPELRAAISMSGSVHPFNTVTGEEDPLHTLCDAMDALAVGRRADVGVQGFSAERTDADGRTGFLIGLSLLNRGFATANAVCTMTVSDPYATPLADRVCFGGMGTSSVASRDGCLSFAVSEDCPSGHVIELEITVSADGAQERVFAYSVTYSRSIEPPAVIDGDLSCDSCSVVIQRDTVIEEGARLRLGPGCELSMKEKEGGGMPVLTVRGGLLMTGTPDSPVTARADGIATVLTEGDGASVVLEHCASVDLMFGGTGAGPVFRSSTVDITVKDASGHGFRIGSATDSQFWLMTHEVIIGHMADSLLVLQKTDGVRMEDDGSLLRTLVGVQPYGCSTAFRLAGEVNDCVFTDMGRMDAGQATFEAAPDTVYDRVCFHDGLKDMSPFEENWGSSEVSKDRIWPFIERIIFVDIATDETVEPDELTNTEYFVYVLFSRDVVMSDTFGYLSGDNSSYRLMYWEMVDSSECAGYLDLCGQPCDIGMSLTLNGWAAADDPDRQVPFFEEKPSVRISSDLGSEMPVEARDDGGRARIEWIPDGLSGYSGFSVDRYDDPDGEPLSVCRKDIADHFVYFSYVDEDVEPGRTYWYSVSYLDSEGNRAATAGPSEVRIADTHPPVIVHRTQRDCMEGKDLKLSFTVTDDAELTCVMLKHRQIGTCEWRAAELSADGEKYIATIPGEQVKGEGVEYFIWASDSENFAFCGDSDHPMRCPAVRIDGTAVGLSALALVLLAVVPLLFLRRD